MNTGANIRNIRKEKGLSQVEVSQKAGIAVNSLRLYEADKRHPNLETLEKIADALGVSVMEFLPKPSKSKEQQGKRLYEARTSKGMTIEELAEKTQISVETLRNYENETQIPHSSQIYKICEALELDYNFLTEGISSEEKDSILEQYLGHSGIIEMDDKMQLKINCAAVSSYMEKMNRAGQAVAVQTVKTLADMPEYQKKDEPVQE